MQRYQSFLSIKKHIKYFICKLIKIPWQSRQNFFTGFAMALYAEWHYDTSCGYDRDGMRKK